MAVADQYEVVKVPMYKGDLEKLMNLIRKETEGASFDDSDIADKLSCLLDEVEEWYMTEAYQ